MKIGIRIPSLTPLLQPERLNTNNGVSDTDDRFPVTKPELRGGKFIHLYPKSQLTNRYRTTKRTAKLNSHVLPLVLLQPDLQHLRWTATTKVLEIQTGDKARTPTVESKKIRIRQKEREHQSHFHGGERKFEQRGEGRRAIFKFHGGGERKFEEGKRKQSDTLFNGSRKYCPKKPHLTHLFTNAHIKNHTPLSLLIPTAPLIPSLNFSNVPKF